MLFVHVGRRAALAVGRISCSRLLFTERGLLKDLRRNPEISEEDARNELRWISQSRNIPSTSQTGDVGCSVDKMVRARGDGVPLQYVLGDTDFGPLTLQCRAPTLIPRPETAHCFGRLAEQIAADSSYGEALNIVDLCTGSAPIPLLLKHIARDRVSQCIGIDISESALELACLNIKSTAIDGVSVWQASVFDDQFAKDVLAKLGNGPNGRSRKLDLLTANPPYIPTALYRDLPPSVRLHEDEGALHSGADDILGLRFYRRIAELLPELLDYTIKGPRVAVEVGEGQADAVVELFRAQGMSRLEVWCDQWEVERLVVGWTQS